MLEEERYANEIIIPVLINMGFIDVRSNHGILEFGKDILFSKFDDFGIKKYYAAQVKSKDINGRKSGDLEEIISHIDRAFNIPFPDLATKEYVTIDEFFVITSSNYIGNAREQLVRDQRIKKYGNRLHFFDGNKIRELGERNLGLYKEKINGLITELRYNAETLNKILKDIDIYKMEETIPLVSLKLHNLENYLESFKNQDFEIVGEMYALHIDLICINSILDRFRLGLALIEHQEKYIKENFPKSMVKIQSLIEKLSPLIESAF